MRIKTSSHNKKEIFTLKLRINDNSINIIKKLRMIIQSIIWKKTYIFVYYILVEENFYYYSFKEERKERKANTHSNDDIHTYIHRKKERKKEICFLYDNNLLSFSDSIDYSSLFLLRSASQLASSHILPY